MRMLENEGYSYEGYVDIFDGGPTMLARTDKVRSIRDAAHLPVVTTELESGEKALLATGRLSQFRCCYGAHEVRDGGIAIDAQAADLLRLSEGDMVWSIAR